MFARKNTRRAAHILAERRRKGERGERLPADCRPPDLEAALAIQEAVTQELGDTVGGWKCLEPPPERLVLGPIYERDITRSSSVRLWAPDGVARIEPELGFVLGRDLPARAQPYSKGELDAAIAQTHLVLELIQSRYRDPAEVEFSELLADGLLNQGLFMGPEIDGELGRNAREIPITLRPTQGSPQHFQGRHPNGLPRAPFYWLAEFLRSRGQDLKEGQVIITGSYAGVLEAPLNQPVTIRFGNLGEFTLEFEAR